ncbi:MAG TPA: hypothetical protein VKS81_03955 [Bacteroidota bacterium]|nr:hypothetical protein [Bacteroidota bacterium]
MLTGMAPVRRIAAYGILPLLFLLFFAGDSRDTHPRKLLDDNETKYTSVGNIGLTISNFGTIGDRNAYWPAQPSCEYPRGSGIEHIYQGALWVGAVLKPHNPNDPRGPGPFVSTGSSDQASGASVSGVDYEFTNAPGAGINEISILADDRPSTSQFSALAVSDQDFVCDYTDTNTHVPETGDSILNHNPLGINIHQESYAWNLPFADFFVILQYTIKNVSADTLDSLYVGQWNNAVVHNTQYVKPGTPGYFNNTAQGYDSTYRMAYSFDFNGAPGGPTADSYVGVKLLGAYPFPSGIDSIGMLHLNTYYNAWQYRSASGDEAYLSPKDDFNNDPFASKYSRLTQSMPQNKISALRTAPQDVSYLISTGPFSRLNPGDSLVVAFAVICAKKFGHDPANFDTPAQRQTLYANSLWAQQCYQGEDVNGNNILDPGEDFARRDSVSPTEYGLRYEPDGKITRYLLPAPPRPPKVRVEVGNQSTVIYWDKSSSELSIDPISAKRNFEGYRIYRSKAGQDISDNANLLLDLELVGDFDKPDNIGYNTGFSQITLSTPKKFTGDTVSYWYRFPPVGDVVPQLNGWQYIYAISAYSTGDSANNVPSLESARSYFRVVPGATPKSLDSAAVSVYPNPYYANAAWDGPSEYLRKIYFTNLPARCQIVIYTLAGDVVQVLDHDAATYHGENIQWFSNYGDTQTPTQLAGGEHAWDLITRHNQAIATGLYLFTVRDVVTGKTQRGKFLIVK